MIRRDNWAGLIHITERTGWHDGSGGHEQSPGAHGRAPVSPVKRLADLLCRNHLGDRCEEHGHEPGSGKRVERLCKAEPKRQGNVDGPREEQGVPAAQARRAGQRAPEQRANTDAQDADADRIGDCADRNAVVGRHGSKGDQMCCCSVVALERSQGHDDDHRHLAPYRQCQWITIGRRSQRDAARESHHVVWMMR